MENNQFIPIEDRGEIVLYQPDDNVRLEVRLQDDTVWLTQQQMTELLETEGQVPVSRIMCVINNQ